MTFTMWDVMDAASDVLNHDTNPDDGIEQFMRQHYPRASKRFIAAVECEAVELRDRMRLHGLFEYINEQVSARPDDAKVSNDLATEKAEDIAVEMQRVARREGNTGWHRTDAIKVEATRYAALLLIAFATWRKHDDEMKAAEEKFAAEEGLV